MASKAAPTEQQSTGLPRAASFDARSFGALPRLKARGFRDVRAGGCRRRRDSSRRPAAPRARTRFTNTSRRRAGPRLPKLHSDELDSTFVEHPLSGSRQRVVPAIGLLSMPSRTVRITSLFTSSSDHKWVLGKVDPPPATRDIEAHRSHHKLRGIAFKNRFNAGERRPCPLNRNRRNDQTPVH